MRGCSRRRPGRSIRCGTTATSCPSRPSRSDLSLYFGGFAVINHGRYSGLDSVQGQCPALPQRAGLALGPRQAPVAVGQLQAVKLHLGPGSISEDARGRWYLNITVKVARTPKPAAGIERDVAPALAVAQRANKKAELRDHSSNQLGNRRKPIKHTS